MKWFVYPIILAFTTSATAQFIPQAMGYNPDENSDGLIGVGDLQGLLALYGSAFENADSITVATVQLNGDNSCWTSPGQEFILPDADIIYLDVEGYDSGQSGLYSTYNCFKMKLPQGVGFKTILVIPPHHRYIPIPESADHNEMYYVQYNFYSDNDPWTPQFSFYGGGNLHPQEFNDDSNRKWFSYLFLRDHQGFWRPLNGVGGF